MFFFIEPLATEHQSHLLVFEVTDRVYKIVNYKIYHIDISHYCTDFCEPTYVDNILFFFFSWHASVNVSFDLVVQMITHNTINSEDTVKADQVAPAALRPALQVCERIISAVLHFYGQHLKT